MAVGALLMAGAGIWVLRGIAMHANAFRSCEWVAVAVVRMALIAVGALCAGCSVNGTTNDPATAVMRPAQDDLTRGETVSIHLISTAEWKSPIYSSLQISLPELPPPPVRSTGDAANTSNRFLPAVAGAGVGALVGLVIDGVKAAIKEEAEKHERQFRQTTYATDFWAGLGVPKYRAIEVLRYADGFAQPSDGSMGTPAERLIIAILPSEHDSRLLLLKLVYLEINAAKAKVSPDGSGKRRMTMKLNVIMVGAHVGTNGEIVQSNLADTSFVRKGIDLGTQVKLSSTWSNGAWTGDLRDYVAGFFFAPRVSSDTLVPLTKRLAAIEEDLSGEPTGKPENTAHRKKLSEERTTVETAIDKASRGGAFGLTVAVTETDESRAKESLLQVADFVGAQRGAAVDAAKSLVPSGK